MKQQALEKLSIEISLEAIMRINLEELRLVMKQ